MSEQEAAEAIKKLSSPSANDVEFGLRFLINHAVDRTSFLLLAPAPVHRFRFSPQADTSEKLWGHSNYRQVAGNGEPCVSNACFLGIVQLGPGWHGIVIIRIRILNELAQRTTAPPYYAPMPSNCWFQSCLSLQTVMF